MSLLGKIGKLLGQHPEAAATTGKVARERLTVILASQRGSELLQDVDMQALQRDVLEVVRVSFV
jgi:septum formation topological specificity factor MinE